MRAGSTWRAGPRLPDSSAILRGAVVRQFLLNGSTARFRSVPARPCARRPALARNAGKEAGECGYSARQHDEPKTKAGNSSYNVHVIFAPDKCVTHSRNRIPSLEVAWPRV